MYLIVQDLLLYFGFSSSKGDMSIEFSVVVLLCIFFHKLVVWNKIFNGNDFTIYWDDHVFFRLSLSLYLSVSLSSINVLN